MIGTVSTHPKWTEQQFLCFILLYASMADLEMTEEEQQMILDKVDRDCLMKIREEFEKNNDYERIQIIQSYKEQYFPNAEKKSELLFRIEALFESDGTYSQTEHGLFMMLRKIL